MSLPQPAIATAALLPEPTQLHLLGLTVEGATMIATAIVTASTRPCPRCGRRSARVHSRYRRMLADLPWLGLARRLEGRVRKVFCDTSAGDRQIFTQRLPGVVAASGRRTLRLETWLTRSGFALGGEAGARLLCALGLGTRAVSADGLLGGIRRFPAEGPAPVGVLSVDDFAFRGGRRYGTLLVDLERHAPIDGLPDRTADPFAAWLEQQPWAKQIPGISPDRGGDSAEGARRGAPQARQVADRFHLGKNGGEVAERVLRRPAAALQGIAGPTRATAAAGSADPPPLAATTAAPRLYRQACKARTQVKKTPRYEAIHALAPHGRTRCAMARALGLKRKTLPSSLAADAVPQRPPQVRKASILRPYEPYRLERWGWGVPKGLKRWREIGDRGAGRSRHARQGLALRRLSAPVRG